MLSAFSAVNIRLSNSVDLCEKMTFAIEWICGAVMGVYNSNLFPPFSIFYSCTCIRSLFVAKISFTGLLIIGFTIPSIWN